MKTKTSIGNMVGRDLIHVNGNNEKKIPFVFVQIPAYNESKTIGEVIKNIPRTIKGVREVRILVSDDCSTDDTIEVSKKSGADYILQNKNNTGLGSNFKRALNNSLKLGADIIVNIDGDGQFNPKDIQKLIQPILDGEADMVTCTRFKHPDLTKNMPALKKWGNKRFTNLINRITGHKFTDTQCGFRAYSKEAGLRLNLFGKFTYTQEVFIDLASKGLRIVEVPLEVNYFKDRKSNVSGKLSRYGFKSLGIIAKATRDTQPLSFFGIPGGIAFSLGILGGFYSFLYWILTSTTSPVRTLFNVSVFLMSIGFALMMLALIADMLRRTNMNQDEILYQLKKRDLEGG